MWSFYLLVLVALCWTHGARSTNECGKCDEQSCRPPVDCLAGIVRDRCGCCFQCGRREGEQCDDGDELPLPYRKNIVGPCGENLECRPRTDLAPGDEPTAHCVCQRTDTLCGSDDQTYANECQLTEARYKRRDGLAAVHRGPCDTPPKIVSPPEDVTNVTGGHAVMSCEAVGWPIPRIEWRIDIGDGNRVPLPSDDPNTAVNTRGGPSKYEVTGWLQMVDLTEKDSAAYWCIAKNEKGEDSASARIYVVDSEQEL